MSKRKETLEVGYFNFILLMRALKPRHGEDIALSLT